MREREKVREAIFWLARIFLEHRKIPAGTPRINWKEGPGYGGSGLAEFPTRCLTRRCPNPQSLTSRSHKH